MSASQEQDKTGSAITADPEATQLPPSVGPHWYSRVVTDAQSRSEQGLGLLDLSVDLSVPEVFSGTEFTLYLHVKNPFAFPIWVKSVELALPTQLVGRPSGGDMTLRHSNARLLRREAQRKLRGVAELENQIQKDLSQAHEHLREELAARRLAYARDLDRLAGLGEGAIVEAENEAEVHIEQARSSRIALRAQNSSVVHVESYQDLREPERVPLLGSLPEKAALQPGSTDVWTIRLGSKRSPFFIPARYRLQLTVVYGLDVPSEGTVSALHANTVTTTVPVRAALWTVLLGGITGGALGSLSRSLQSAVTIGTVFGNRLGTTLGSLLLALLLSGAAVVFSARKAEAQNFITVEDFWGGVVVGFLIGYSGTAAFAQLTGATPQA